MRKSIKFVTRKETEKGNIVSVVFGDCSGIVCREGKEYRFKTMLDGDEGVYIENNASLYTPIEKIVIDIPEKKDNSILNVLESLDINKFEKKIIRERTNLYDSLFV